MKYFFFLFACVFSTELWALPDKVEVWFLSPPKYTQFIHRLKLPRYFAFTETVHKQCQKSGELFFHPQVGLHDHLGSVPGVMAQPMLTQDEVDKLEREGSQAASETKFLSNLDVDLVSCDSNYYFDLYCGKSKGQNYAQKSGGIEVWVDTSSSLNQVDRKDKDGECYRKSFAKRLLSACSRLQVSVFDTSLKALGSESVLCDGIGLNDQTRLIQWIQESRAKKLLVITDIYELTTKFSEFLVSIGAHTKGDIPQKELVGADLLRFSAEYQKTCH